MTIGAPIFYPAGPIEIRDGTFDRVKTVAGLKNAYTARAMPGQDALMPYAVIWNAGERTEANGDGNVGPPSFLHTLTLVIDVMVRAPSEASLDSAIVTLVETIRATLMTDSTWVNLFEGIERCDTRYSYPKEATDVVVQGMIEFEVTFRSEWPPVLLNDFTSVHISTRGPCEPAPGAWNDFSTQFNLPQDSDQ